MSLPFEYDRVAVGEFGGTTPTTTDFEHARVVILPVPLDRTTSYVAGTRNGPHEILVASSHMELWDEETAPTSTASASSRCRRWNSRSARSTRWSQEIRRVASEIVGRGKFPVVIGGEHSITPPIVAAIAERHPGLSVLQIDAHADLRDHLHGDAAQPRVRDAPRARVRANDAGRHPQPVARRGRRDPVAADARVLRLQHARRPALDGSRRRLR